MAQRTQAAQRLITAMGRPADEARDAPPEASAEMAVALARLRIVAGEIDEAIGLITASPTTRARFCATLSEFTWILSAS